VRRGACELERGDVRVADDHDEKREAHIRSAIIQHLCSFPLAGDTPEGMVACWLPSSGYEGAIQVIGKVVETMVAAGELAPRSLPGGRVLFVRGPALVPLE
jgi:hypothetical protein